MESRYVGLTIFELPDRRKIHSSNRRNKTTYPLFKCEDGVPAVVNQIDFNDVVTEISVVHILSWKMNIDNMNMKKTNTTEVVKSNKL